MIPFYNPVHFYSINQKVKLLIFTIIHNGGPGRLELIGNSQKVPEALLQEKTTILLCI